MPPMKNRLKANGRRHWEGELLGPQGDSAGVRTEDGNEHWFEWVDVKSARLVVDPWAGLRNAKTAKPERQPRGGER